MKTKKMFKIEMVSHFYNDHGEYVSQEGYITVDSERVEWYKANNGKPLCTGDIFYIANIRELD